ncbi:hypothetical protein HDU98_004388, partial [Podochytrium sp. JEL0797]
MARRRWFLSPRARTLLLTAGCLLALYVIYRVASPSATGPEGSGMTRAEARRKASKTILYLSSSQPGKENMQAVVDHLRTGLQLEIEDKTPHLFGTTRASALHAVKSGSIAHLCSRANTLILGDSLPKSRAVLESLLPSTPAHLQCQSRVIIELTNRFDFAVGPAHLEEYYALMRDLVQVRPRNLGWVVSSEFEVEYLREKVGVKPEKYVVLKPMGVLEGDAEDPRSEKQVDHRLGIHPHLDRNLYEQIVELENSKVIGYPGLAKHILRFKGYIEFPGVVSNIEFHNRLAHGVPLLVPSAKYLEKLVE